VESDSVKAAATAAVDTVAIHPKVNRVGIDTSRLMRGTQQAEIAVAVGVPLLAVLVYIALWIFGR
jgi:hypothetical protein